ncbi:glycogen debranching protein GlgX [Planctomonas psychrotolerans]|uniref:glycogen debranching protein GlgX n=1 Tax=Planctomonas psychrotolerans TaxID=2528712 RepID=UPI00123844E7|nr:glycogen debranching protein GlgX [Planctomonas psychrotolerans]
MEPSARLPDLGVRSDPTGGTLRVFSAHASSMQVCIFDDTDPHWVVDTLPMDRDDAGVWTVHSPALRPGTSYTVRADGPRGPRHAFDPAAHLLDPYARGVRRVSADSWRAVVPTPDRFDWGAVRKPATPLDRTVVYEAHVKGISRLNPNLPENIRGTYAGLGAESTTDYLNELGVTAVELLPVQQFVSEQRLIRQGLRNYWGYNTLNFFAPHAAYASPEARAEGPDAIAREFKTMVKNLHAAGLEVLLDVVYNHTAEEGRDGPRFSLRGLDNATYYRSDDDGRYIDVTGCGNSIDFSSPEAVQLVLDSLSYWTNDMQVDGFRFDLAATLGRNGNGEYDPRHPLLTAIVSDPALSGAKMIAEPWDIGYGGWQTGNFPPGFLEWNDGYRDRVRDFWLSDIRSKRENGSAQNGIGSFAGRLAGSAETFGRDRDGPLASLNFVTAHDGFTLADLTVHNHKHNVGNGESNRDGTDNNHSFNHGVEGWSTDRDVLRNRLRSMRNMLGTLLFSAGVPMITAGDEFGRSQHGNNNPYCHDSELTWMSWDLAGWQKDLLATTRRLLELRRENPALRPTRFGVPDASTPGASEMLWFSAQGDEMHAEYWNSPDHRTLQYLAASTPEREPYNRILLMVHGLESTVDVRLPVHPGVVSYTLLWDSGVRMSLQGPEDVAPGDTVTITGPSLRLYRAD